MSINARSIADEAKATGRVYICGEMDFPANEGVAVAWERANHIAEECGYIVNRNRNSAILTIYPPYSSQYVTLDWISPERPDLAKVTVWTPQEAYLR